MRRAMLLLVLCAAAVPARSADAPPAGPGMLVAYTPLGYQPDPAWQPRAGALRDDAADLIRIGAGVVVTERATASLTPVCRFLRRGGVGGVIVGVADPSDTVERRRARHARRCAAAYAVGDGGLAARRYDRGALEAAVTRLRRVTGRPVWVRERAASFIADPALLRAGDGTLALVEPELRFGAQEACGATMQAHRDMLERAPPGRAVILVTGLPTGTPGASEHAQRAYFSCLASRRIPFVSDEAYDQPWRGGGAATRGLFRRDGTPKLFVWQLARPRIAIESPAPALAGRVTSATPSRYRLLLFAQGAQWEPLPSPPLSRSGRWRATVPAGRPIAAYLTGRDHAVPGPVARLPAVDGVHLFATAPAPGAP